MNQEYKKTNTIIKIKDVSLILGNNLILKDINLEVKDIHRAGFNQGQVNALLAPSGVGKSQLLKLLAGLQKPNSGTIEIGHPLKPVCVGDVGVVQQNFPLFDHKTVIGNLQVVSTKFSPSEKKERISAYLHHFNMWDKKDLYPAQLSGGQKQRVAIAQQLLCSEHYLLLDEPFSGLDVNMIDTVLEMLTQISQLHELNTIFIVSHDISSACAVSDTVFLLGKDRNPGGGWEAGATIKKQYDLIERGLVWDKNIRNSPKFSEFTKEIRNEFKNLG